MSVHASSPPIFSASPSNGAPATSVSKPEDGNGQSPSTALGPGVFHKHMFTNPFPPSPRPSPGGSDQRSPDPAHPLGSPDATSTGEGRSAPVFRPTFTNEPKNPIHRALDPIPPDQREPFITVDSPSAPAGTAGGSNAAFRTAENERPYPPIESQSHLARVGSDSGLIDSVDENLVNMRTSVFRQASLGPGVGPGMMGAGGSNFPQRQNSFSNSLTPRHSVSVNSENHYVSSGLSGPPVTLNSSTPSNSNVIQQSDLSSVLPSSPISSASAADKNLDTQIKNHPFLHDILDRVIRTEYAQRDLSRELGALSSKINFIAERLEQADSRRSFSSSPNPGGLIGTNMPMPPAGLGPLQAAGAGDGDISKRLDALTNSVERILMIQQNSMNPGGHGNNGPFPGNGPVSPGGFDGVPNMNMNMNMGIPGGLGPPSRPHSRNPPPPVRTWSAGSLDMPLRQDPHLGRPDVLLNQKRRSIVGNLNRRDSTATVDSDWGVNSPRDSGPTVTKWEHLQLVPDLLRSISKYGVGPPNKIQQRALPFLLNGADIIAQAPPTQERIAAYVIPAIHIALTTLVVRPQNRGPIVVIISTTVDQATQAQRMIRDLGGAIGVRSALGVGTGGDVQQEIRLLQQNVPHILCGTPQKLHALFTTPGGLPGNEVRFLVLDEVDQLIARNLHEFVFNIVKLLPTPPRQQSSAPGGPGPVGPNGNSSASPNPSSFTPFGSPGETSGSPSTSGNGFGNGRRFPPLVHSPNPNDPPGSQMLIVKRQTALFSNTVPQDVLNLANAIQLRDPVRVLVRRDGNVTSSESYKNAGGGLKQFYLYLAFTASGGRIDNNGGLGIIGSGRANQNTPETAQAKEWKLEALGDLLDDIEVAQAIVHVGNTANLDAVTYKLASRGLDAIPLHTEMSTGAKMAALNKFRGNNSLMMKQQPSSRVLVVFDVQVKSPDVFQVPLVINYDLPKAVEDYATRVAPAIASSYSRPGVVVNFVTATGGDVEMLRSIECHYKIKCPEVPTSLRDVL